MTSVAAMAWPSSRSKQDDDLREQHFSDSQRRFVKRAGFRKPALFFDSARGRVTSFGAPQFEPKPLPP